MVPVSASFSVVGVSKLNENHEVMLSTQRYVLTLSIAALAALVLGCASSGPSTTQAPPETPEKRPAPTTTTAGEQPGSDGSGGSGGAEGSGRSGQEGISSDGTESGGGDPSSDGIAAGADSGDAREQGESSAGGAFTGPSGGQPPTGSPATGAETAAALDGELEGSLGEFDDRMRSELQRLAEEAANAELAGSQPTGDSTAGGGADRGDGPPGSTEDVGDTSGAVGGSGPGATGSDRVPDDVGDGSDDDIVARQLREAATAEEDPELRAKLWEEYRRYKASLGGSSQDDQ